MKSKNNNVLIVPNISNVLTSSEMSNNNILIAKIKKARDKIKTLGFLDNLYDKRVNMNRMKTIPIILISK